MHKVFAFSWMAGEDAFGKVHITSIKDECSSSVQPFSVSDLAPEATTLFQKFFFFPFFLPALQHTRAAENAM